MEGTQARRAVRRPPSPWAHGAAEAGAKPGAADVADAAKAPDKSAGILYIRGAARIGGRKRSPGARRFLRVARENEH